MTLFTLLLVLVWERLFKLSDHWQLDHRLEGVFHRLTRISLLQTVLLTAVWMWAVWVCLWIVDGLFFSFIQLFLWVLICLLCIGAGKYRQYYRAYLKAAREGDAAMASNMARELVLFDSSAVDRGNSVQLSDLQNTLLWINLRYYLAPVFWFVACGFYGPVVLAGYAFLRAYQRFLTRYNSPEQLAQSGVGYILYWVDWLPVRLAGLIYVLLGRGEKVLSVWVSSLKDFHSQQYQVLTGLAQLSLARDDSHSDPMQTLRAAVSLARKVTWTMVVVVALLTIFGAVV